MLMGLRWVGFLIQRPLRLVADDLPHPEPDMAVSFEKFEYQLFCEMPRE